MNEYDLRLNGADAVLPGLGRVPVDICIAAGKITALVERGTTSPPARETLDVSGRVIVPGGIDAHVHLGQDLVMPRNSDDAGLETASAVAGGVTTIVAYLMSPQPYEAVYEPAAGVMEQYSHTDYGFHFCLVTPEQIKAVPRYVEDFGVSSFKFFMNFRGDEGAYLGLPGNDDGFLFDILRITAEHGAMANPHAENIELIWRLRDEVPRDPDAGLAAWDRVRPGFVEAEAEQRVAYLASVVGASVYAVHVSSEAALNSLIRQREHYDNIFIETCPHYLTLDVNSPIGTRGKVNPPLRSKADRDALWSALGAGVVDVVGSDHVHRHFSAKDKQLWDASAGFPGVGTLLPLLISEGTKQHDIPLERLVETISTNPAKIFGMYPQKGAIQVGADADLAVLDLDGSNTVQAATQHSSSQYSVWEGWMVGCRVEHTLVRGRFALRAGVVQDPSGHYVARARSGRAAIDAARTGA